MNYFYAFLSGLFFGLAIGSLLRISIFINKKRKETVEEVFLKEIIRFGFKRLK